ncbi:RagB/SusD family nutrient uptake outer membrane protein [uncultured Sunxiuqinia sp.]|uniref:RagB/SusD family nutrient uptake outer membrane protein n=1 Tax=uncultured Sunxiuqinia sp. TaxID=1573825 RepID=UPI002627E06E|nr:RagB/SusD family nutrient uptake outer membrane protein [uncultured Sunxiuqinia sp.]
MKINRIISLLLVVVFSWGYQGCTNLDEEVYDKLPVEEFGKTPNEINSLIAPIYRTFKNVFPSNYLLLSECSGDMAVTPTRKGGDWWDGGQFKELRFHSWTPSTSLVVSSYNAAMEGITLCNKVYKMIDVNEAIENKDRILAEIRGVRAFWYYMLVDYYGNVPIVTDFEDTSLPSTKSRAEVYDFVVSELNAIKDLVRDDVSSSSYGKVTKGMVYTLLAKMYLNAEIWNPDGGAKWQECIAACDEVLDLAYIIEPNFKASFAVQNQTSQEIIFPAIFSTSDGGNHIHKRTLHYLDPVALNLKVGTWNGVSAMPAYVKSFDEADKRFDWSFLTGEMKDPATGDILITAHGRPLIHTLDIELKYNVDEDGWGQVEQEEGARCSKWEFENGLNGDMENDFGIFRLADVYLMKAEALVRLGIENGEATRLVNELRKRAFDESSKLLGSVTLDDIYNERRFELAWEGFTRQDMIRFGKFLDPIEGWKGQTDEKYLLFPIPRTALDANENLSQNPGY